MNATLHIAYPRESQAPGAAVAIVTAESETAPNVRQTEVYADHTGGGLVDAVDISAGGSRYIFSADARLPHACARSTANLKCFSQFAADPAALAVLQTLQAPPQVIEKRAKRAHAAGRAWQTIMAGALQEQSGFEQVRVTDRGRQFGMQQLRLSFVYQGTTYVAPLLRTREELLDIRGGYDGVVVDFLSGSAPHQRIAAALDAFLDRHPLPARE